MGTHIHVLRNHLTTAVLTATAMLDGKLPANTSNLRGLVSALQDVSNIVASVSKYDWDERANGDHFVDIQALLESVADDLSFVASAADVGVLVAEPAPPAAACRHFCGNRNVMHATLEGAARWLVSSLPAGSSVELASVSADAVLLTVSTPGKVPGEAEASLAEISPELESHGARVHQSRLGTYCVHLPGRWIGASPASCDE